MKIDRFATLVFAGGFALTTAALAQDTPKKPHVPLEKSIGIVTPTGPVPSLAVINSGRSQNRKRQARSDRCLGQLDRLC